MERLPVYQDDDNVMYATTHKYGHTGGTKIDKGVRGFLKRPWRRILTAVLIGALLGATLGAIAGSLRLAVGFGIGFGLISGLIFDSEIRHNSSDEERK
jgi:hypothetical protein